MRTREVGNGVFLIDDNLYSISAAGAVYLVTGNKNALVDTGPLSSLDAVRQALKQLGFGLKDIDYVFVTHIHLDHAGGAWALLEEAPQAKIVAHYRAVRHLIDPSRLVQSATAAQGDDTDERNGPVRPVHESRIIPVREGDMFQLDSVQQLSVLECPGHAPHEICILESRNRGVFVGDAVAHNVEGTQISVPITPPPSFDLELYLQTLKRLGQLDASRIYFPHFGVSCDVSERLEAAANELLARQAIVEDASAQGALHDASRRVIKHVGDMLAAIKDGMKPLHDDWMSHDVPMSALEHVRYFARKNGISVN